MNKKSGVWFFLFCVMLTALLCGGASATVEEPSPTKDKPMQMKFDMIGLFVTDMGRMTRFYHEALGFEIKEGGTDDSPYTELTGAGIRFSMFKRALLPQILGREPGYPKGLNGTMELAVNVGAKENVDKVYAEMVSKGAAPVYAPRDEPWKMRSAMVADPEGNLVEIGSDFWN